jgi:hypothetical protein
MILKADTSDDVLELSVVDVAPPVPPHSLGGDRRVCTRVEIDGFAARTTDWVAANAWLTFLAGLEARAQTRRGEVSLEGLSPDQLRLRFFATDRAGHVAVAGQVRKRGTDGHDCRLEFAALPIEGSQLAALVAELRAAVPAA